MAVGVVDFLNGRVLRVWTTETAPATRPLCHCALLFPEHNVCAASTTSVIPTQNTLYTIVLYNNFNQVLCGPYHNLVLSNRLVR